MFCVECYKKNWHGQKNELKSKCICFADFIYHGMSLCLPCWKEVVERERLENAPKN